ncbi:MAG TPA: type II toxin-antitoxin system RelE/ParE family toxin [Terricaulis sp.]|nr:type II toxin-antitoxin system RelE/ParE family toxin [Terricaulis sp.]
MEIEEYLDAEGHSPFGHWFDALEAVAAARVTIALTRAAQGNLANAKSVGGGVSEIRLDFGSGYRIYFGRDGMRLIVLLAGGTKKRQQRDIEAAKDRWAEYKRHKRKS